MHYLIGDVRTESRGSMDAHARIWRVEVPHPRAQAETLVGTPLPQPVRHQGMYRVTAYPRSPVASWPIPDSPGPPRTMASLIRATRLIARTS